MISAKPQKTPSHYQELFERAYQNYHTQIRQKLDPVHIVHKYSDPKDQEIIGFLSALLAYGNVQTIVKSIDIIREPLGKSPFDFLTQTGKLPTLFSNFRHRFTTGVDVEILLARLKVVLEKFGSIEAFFTEGKDTSTTDLKIRMESFVTRFRAIELPTHLRKEAIRRDKELRYLLSSPKDGSACKRLNLFLRWMVRPKDGVDLGIWTKVSASALYLPVDTHLLKLLIQLGWTRSNSATWRVVELATAQLREINQADPIRYDFSLCHLSMNKDSLLPPGKHNKRPHAPMERRPLHQESPKGKLRRAIRL